MVVNNYRGSIRLKIRELNGLQAYLAKETTISLDGAFKGHGPYRGFRLGCGKDRCTEGCGGQLAIEDDTSDDDAGDDDASEV